MNCSGEGISRTGLADAENATARAGTHAKDAVVITEDAAGLGAATVNAKEESHERILNAALKNQHLACNSWPSSRLAAISGDTSLLRARAVRQGIQSLSVKAA
jgi:hypothetical protein